MRYTSERRIDDDLVERHFSLDGIPGILWTPLAASGPLPLVMLGHPGNLDVMYPRLLARARSGAEQCFASLSIELPGAGERPPLPGVDQARRDLRHALENATPPTPDIIDRLVLPLVDRAAPEWRAALDDVHPDLGGPIGYSGGIISVGIRLAVTEPRIVAAGLFAGSYVPDRVLDEARRVTIPVHVLLQWDDEGNDRATALDLFDALGSAEKTLEANMGGHRGVPAHAGENAAGFFARHLGPARAPAGG